MKSVCARSSNIFPWWLGNVAGGSGAGHGGSGGRGSFSQTVGLGYDSMYTPTTYGCPGGYGKLRGNYKIIKKIYLFDFLLWSYKF